MTDDYESLSKGELIELLRWQDSIISHCRTAALHKDWDAIKDSLDAWTEGD